MARKTCAGQTFTQLDGEGASVEKEDDIIDVGIWHSLLSVVQNTTSKSEEHYSKPGNW